ncbi:MAG: hypothetical protein IK093_06490, partial [Ruminiclostridium sp.]|nr:hypothetical protein [Ruminiclostridium sp.]
MKYYLYKLKTLKAHIITMFILSFASYPLFCIVFSDYVSAWAAITDKSNSDLYRNSPEYYIAEASIRDKASTTVFMAVIGAVALIALFTMGIPILMKCFGYLHKKPRADMEMTAPVTAGTRFFGNFFAGLTVYLVPHIIAVIIGSAVLGGNFGDSQTEAFCDIVKRMMIYGIMMCVLFYCTTTLIAAVCGRTRTAVIITVFMNLAAPVITFTSGVLSFRYGFGLYTGLIDEMTGKVSWLTPLGLLIRFFVRGIFGTKSDGDIGIMQLIPFLLYCAAFVAAAYFLVKHRRHERTGSAYAFRYARHVFTGTAILAVTMATATEAVLSFEDYYFRGISPATAAGITVVYMVVWLLASFGCFCAFEFAESKGEKHRKKRFILLAPLIIGSVAVTYLSTLTQGYGAAYDIPDVSEI